MIEEEAIRTLHEQVTQKQGFVAKLRAGDGIDRVGLTRAEVAVDTLTALWEDQLTVPKRAAYPLVDVFTPISTSSSSYPGQEAEIVRIAFDFEMRIEGMFMTGQLTASEEWAAGMILAHLTGVPSLALILHHHEPLTNFEWIQDLQTAFDTLAKAWADRTSVPKILVGPMLSIKGLIVSHAQLYPQEQARLETIADDLTERVKRCLR
ncbi:MAG TPA: hypothetical protein VMV29_19965 [Ktedonobacterales bacterium]|nr:hypothetical protein [Ktedonobacterales bacterium]